MSKLELKSDLTFIGSGISTSFCLLNFLKKIEAEEKVVKTIDINVIEKYSEFNLGVPYGNRSGYSTLLITSLRNFLIEPELSLFIKWLNKNKTWLLKNFEKEGGLLSKKWLTNNALSIKNNQWEELFIPRRFFGCYIDEKLTEQIDRLTKSGLINVNFINGEVIDIEKNNGHYSIILSNQINLQSTKVILSVGSLPVNYLWKKNEIIQDKNLLFLNNPYHPELNKTLIKINRFLKKRNNETTNVLIVGANASALELLYKINDFQKDTYTNTHFTFLSTQGRVPDATIDETRQTDFIPKHLSELRQSNKPTAKSIAEATFKDLDFADDINLGPASTVEIISKYFGVLLEELSPEELEIFACQYGNAIGKRQRCAGLHYSNTIEELSKDNRFQHIAGRFVELNKNNQDQEYMLVYKDTATSDLIEYDQPFHLIINCVGSQNLESDNLPKLYKNIMSKGLCEPNASKIGFKVNDKLESEANLHIMGPMLAGNVIENRAVWHVEHCGRIIWISKILADIVYRDLIQKNSPVTKNYELDIIELNDNSKINEYKGLLKLKWQNNIYYAYDHLKHFVGDTSALIYFQFKINSEIKIIMPIILRPVNGIKDIPEKYYDAITPYGYSGPLCYEYITESDLQTFWNSVDNWYKENNVISEFIRFSLNRNYIGYNGLLINTLDNVKGKLNKTFETHWQSFSAKVRNNYRKATSKNLEFKTYEGNQINSGIIQAFYDIYTETMVRHQAKSIYFFSSSYFFSLIENNLNSFVIALCYNEDIPISAELIIKNNDTIFAFLGGTNANFYSYRPNDFLRVEIIKWALNKSFKYYVLGGGLKNNDGLYKSKKSFFPKNEDFTFFTGRKIINQKLYDQLCVNNVDNYSELKKADLQKYFFPLYRFNNR